MENPFQIQSIAPEFNSESFAPQSIGCLTKVQLFLLQTSCAKSKSKPIYSPLPTENPYGGKLASKPTINVLSLFATAPELFPPPKKSKTPALTVLTTKNAIKTITKIK